MLLRRPSCHFRSCSHQHVQTADIRSRWNTTLTPGSPAGTFSWCSTKCSASQQDLGATPGIKLHQQQAGGASNQWHSCSSFSLPVSQHEAQPDQTASQTGNLQQPCDGQVTNSLKHFASAAQSLAPSQLDPRSSTHLLRAVTCSQALIVMR